ncbi:MAG: hypothetical protein AB8B64_27115 [Granulosicoccus sp.]
MQSIIKPVRSWLVAPALVMLVAGCSSDTEYDFEGSRDIVEAATLAQSNPEALFNPDPSAPVLPFPNNLFFVGSEDGTLNIPIAPTADQTLSNPQIALNQQDGFSTISPITTAVSKSLDQGTLRLGDTVRVFEVTTTNLPVSLTTAAQRAGARSNVDEIVEELDDESLFDVRQVGDQIVLSPLVPLNPSTSYMVVLTNGITGTDGRKLEPSLVYGLLQGDTPLVNENLEVLRGFVGSHTDALDSANVDLGNDGNGEPIEVVLTWVFSTQSTTDVLQAVKGISGPTTLVLVAANRTTNDVNAALQGKADVFVGSLDLPYYQTPVGEDGNPLPALASFWTNSAGNVPGASDENDVRNNTPQTTGDNVKVPVLMTVPNDNAAAGGAMPDTGWPITVFLHGITSNRTNMLAIADAMADAGRVVIAIDLPMHGITDTDSGLYANDNPLGAEERTFDIDVVTLDATTGVQTPGPDGLIDSSGTHFYNLSNLANSRDNLRQAVADLFVLTANIMEPRTDGLVFDTNNMSFVGHSLGGIVGTTMLAFDNSYQTATLAMPGGGISRLLAGSQSFGPIINGGLASNGVETGSLAYNQFLTAAQTLIESADPINHATTVAAGDTRIHFIEVIDDQVIPNRVEGAPLSGSEPLIALLGLPAVDSTVMGSSGVVRFIEGSHGSILSPESSLAATVEMQTQMATFARSLGNLLPVDNSNNVIQPAPSNQ